MSAKATATTGNGHNNDPLDELTEVFSASTTTGHKNDLTDDMARALPALPSTNTATGLNDNPVDDDLSSVPVPVIPAVSTPSASV